MSDSSAMWRDLFCGCARRTQSFQNNVTRVKGADCIIIEGNYWKAGDGCVLAVHDADWFAAVLDMAVVRQLSMVDVAVDTLRIAPQLLHAHAHSPAPAPAPAASGGAAAWEAHPAGSALSAAGAPTAVPTH